MGVLCLEDFKAWLAEPELTWCRQSPALGRKLEKRSQGAPSNQHFCDYDAWLLMLVCCRRKRDQTDTSLLSLRQQHSWFCGFYNILVIISPLLPLLPSNHLTLLLLTCCSSLCCQYHLQYLSHPMFVCYSRRDLLCWEQTSLISMGRWWWSRQYWRAEAVLDQRCVHHFYFFEGQATKTSVRMMCGSALRSCCPAEPLLLCALMFSCIWEKKLLDTVRNWVFCCPLELRSSC